MYICITYITLLSKYGYGFCVLITAESRAKIWSVKLIQTPSCCQFVGDGSVVVDSLLRFHFCAHLAVDERPGFFNLIAFN